MKIISAWLAAIAAFGIGDGALASQVYLVGFAKGATPSITSVVIPMENMEQCTAAGIKLAANNRDGGNIQGTIDYFRFGYDCVIGAK